MDLSKIMEIPPKTFPKDFCRAKAMASPPIPDPEVITTVRIDRISKGSGISAKDIRELIKQYRQSKKMVKMFKGKGQKGMEKMMKNMQGKLPGM